eukprot:COSAG02_NODE_12_length_58022_cov_242.077379_49_plen_159_part_00
MKVGEAGVVDTTMDSQNLLTTLAEKVSKDHSGNWSIDPGSESDSSALEGPEWLTDIVGNFPDTGEADPETRLNPVHFASEDQTCPDQLLGVQNQATLATSVGAAGALALTVASGPTVATLPGVQENVTHVSDTGRGKKRRARTQIRLEQNAKAQRRYR